MYDRIDKIRNSFIQHGSHNNRIYLFHLDKKDMPNLIEDLDYIANKFGYSKIFAKVPLSLVQIFMLSGYSKEGTVVGFFNDKEDCVFMGKYLDIKRSKPVDKILNKKVLNSAFLKKKSVINLNYDFGSYNVRKMKSNEAMLMSGLYSQVFNSYPIPVFNQEYIQQTMQDNVIYFGVWKEKDLVALASCDICIQDKNVEMTDFAVLPKYRGKNLSYLLLKTMEIEMKSMGINIAYTIARATSYGINCTFAKCNYIYSGVLIQNTQIGGSIEDMNLWYKAL